MLKRTAGWLKRVHAHYETGGLRYTLDIACDKKQIPSWLLYDHRTHLLRLDDRNKLLGFKARQEYEYFAADESHLDELAVLDDFENPQFLRRLFRQFLTEGAQCHAIRHAGRVVAYNWVFRGHYTVTFDGYDKRCMQLDLGPRAVFLGNGFIVPAYRMKGLFPSLLGMALEHGEDTALFSTIDVINLNSLRAHLRLGFNNVGIITCQRVLGSPYIWRWHDTASEARLLGFRQPRIALADLLVGAPSPSVGCRAPS